jgi:hypothetical protein
MSKYDPLWQHIHEQDEAVVELSFDAIRNILGFAIDHSFLNYKKELESYGYRVRKIYLKEKRVVFEKAETSK